MKKHRGWIALDIDGTITDHSHHVPQGVIDYLHSLYSDGWQIIFITGRAFSFGYITLKVFDFPYFLAVQNGADILHMPTKRLVSRHYLDAKAIKAIETLYTHEKEDFIVYTGVDRGDFCYYRPKNFSSSLLAHLHKIMPLSREPWRAVENFDFAPHDKFPLAKCLGLKEPMEAMCNKLKSIPHLTATLIRDPLDADQIYLNLVTHEQATKGKALLNAVKEFGERGVLIAAGDDLNDLAMLEVADFKIVMETAPKSMHGLANLIAPTADRSGIIPALQEAIRLCL